MLNKEILRSKLYSCIIRYKLYKHGLQNIIVQSLEYRKAVVIVNEGVNLYNWIIDESPMYIRYDNTLLTGTLLFHMTDESFTLKNVDEFTSKECFNALARPHKNSKRNQNSGLFKEYYLFLPLEKYNKTWTIKHIFPKV